ncbi:MAG: hypothetical protein ABSB80_06975 [Methanoregula sp.]
MCFSRAKKTNAGIIRIVIDHSIMILATCCHELSAYAIRNRYIGRSFIEM